MRPKIAIPPARPFRSVFPSSSPSERMPPPSKFTPEQLTLLRSKVEGYKTAQLNRRRMPYVKEITALVVENWPSVLPDNWEPIDHPPLPPDAPPDAPVPPTPEQQRATAEKEMDIDRGKVQWSGVLCSRLLLISSFIRNLGGF